eukprot:1507308-Pleurochrysis_carterae.AAC.1
MRTGTCDTTLERKCRSEFNNECTRMCTSTCTREETQCKSKYRRLRKYQNETGSEGRIDSKKLLEFGPARRKRAKKRIRGRVGGRARVKNSTRRPASRHQVCSRTRRNRRWGQDQTAFHLSSERISEMKP